MAGQKEPAEKWWDVELQSVQVTNLRIKAATKEEATREGLARAKKYPNRYTWFDVDGTIKPKSTGLLEDWNPGHE